MLKPTGSSQFCEQKPIYEGLNQEKYLSQRIHMLWLFSFLDCGGIQK